MDKFHLCQGVMVDLRIMMMMTIMMFLMVMMITMMMMMTGVNRNSATKEAEDGGSEDPM